MNLDQIATKCFILALFIRDDGQRLLLGDGYYDFNQKLQHFQANTIANDVVEIQGDNGQLLAGQVMRSGAQKFEGYIGDATTNRQTIEQKRSDFMAFFRIKHFYKVIYIFPDGTAIQRQRGYLTDAPTIPEIFQKFPEYSVALNFEDANYYEYAEDDHGDEIYAHIAELALADEAIGGLIWDAIGAVTNGISWSGIQTAQGEYIQITNELDIPAKLASVEMLGKAEQTTYSGKNLCYETRLNGTNNILFFIDKPASNTITLSATINVATLNNSIYLRVDDIDMGLVGTITGSANTRQSRTLTIPDEQMEVIKNGRIVYLLLYKNNAGFTLPTDAQIELGSTATDYEPYVGGTPAPNPDYPQPISVVTGENVVKIEGKNLFDKDNANILNAYIDPSHTSITYNANNRIIWIPCQPNTTYTLQKLAVGTSWYTRQIAYTTQEPAVGVQTYDMIDMMGNDTSKTYTTGADAKYLVARIWVSGQDAETFDAMLNSVQLELGSTATDYEPYHGQSSEINLGKNLFDSFAISTSGIVVATDGTLTISGNASANGYKHTGKTLAELAPTLKVGDTVYLYLESDWSGTKAVYTSHGGYWTTGTAKTITSDMLSDGVIVYGGYQTTSTIRIMITKSRDSAYAPYFTPIELAKIGNYQDRIYKEDSKWYIEKQVGKVVIDGTESGWGWADTARYTITTANIGAREAISDNFTYVNYTGHATTASPSFDISSNLASIGFHDKDITSLNNFKTWLSTHSTTVYYALATPTTTEITNEALIEQLEALGASSLYIGVNNIGTETLNAMPTLKIEYYTEVDLDGAGYEWEPGGNTAKTIVTVAGADSAWPIWTIQGGAQNPTLTNITTGQTISWQGFVPEGQTLTINMAEMTADLAGANVFEYITGEWLRLAPGNNTLVYNAGNADKPSTLSWNGVLA